MRVENGENLTFYIGNPRNQMISGVILLRRQGSNLRSPGYERTIIVVYRFLLTYIT